MDKISRIWGDRDLIKKRVYPRRYTYEYSSFMENNVQNYLEININSEIMNTLLVNNKLGMGRHTYINETDIP